MHDEVCEICNKGELKKEYNFGQLDARVETFTCGHACCTDTSGGFPNISWHKSYADAAGVARLIVAKEDAFTHRYGF